MIAAAALAALAAVSCRNNGDDRTDLNPEITVVGDTVFDAGSGNLALSLTSTAPWTAETDQAWCVVSPSGGEAGEHTLYLMSEANDSENERNASLLIRSGSLEKRMTIVQKQKAALTLSSSRVEVDSDGGEIVVRVKHNVEIEYEVDKDGSGWIVPVKTRAMDDSRLHFNVDANDSDDKRQGSIIISGGGLTETVTVYQEGIDPDIIIMSQNEYTVSDKGETVDVQIHSNVNYTVSTKEDWLTVGGGGSPSTYTQSIIVKPNDTDAPRTGLVMFESPQYGVKEYVIIRQVQNGAIILVEEEYSVGSEGGLLEFPVISNEAFDVVIPEDCDWISQYGDVTKAIEKYTVTLSVNTNRGTYREAVVTFRGQSAEQTVRILQESGNQYAGRLTLIHTNSTYTVPLIEGGSFNGGTVDWGDGTREEYVTDLTHEYAGTGPYKVVIDVVAAETFYLPDIVGLEELDLSQF